MKAKLTLFIVCLSILSCMGVSPVGAKDVWIAIRTDGAPGIGTKENPYDGSTAAHFNRVMASLSATDNETVHLAAGTYSLAPITITGDNFKLLGAGKDKSTIQWDGTGISTSNTALIYVTTADGFEASGLTIDGRSDAYANTPTRGIISDSGNNVTYRYVRVTRLDYTTVNYELFPLGILTGSDASVTGAVIENCEVDHIDGYATGIVFGYNGVDPTQTVTGVMRGNYVHDSPTINGIGLGGSRNCVITGNRVIGANAGFNRDSAIGENDLITNNHFTGCHQYGLIWTCRANGTDDATAASKGLIIEGNTISVTGERNDTAIINVSGSYLTNTSILNNDLTCTGTPNKYMYGMQLDRIGTGTVVRDNRETAGMSNFGPPWPLP